MVRQPSIAAQNRPPLTRERIIEAALHLIDAQGLARLTMRRLGDSLEVEAMAIYHHLPRGKEQLLDGLVAHVAAVPAEARADDNWQTTLRTWADAYRTRLLDHSGVLPLLVTRRNPVALATTEASLHEVLRLAGLSETTAATGAHTLLGYVIGHTALEVRARAARTAADPEGPINWDDRFTAGLEVLFKGLH